MTPPPHPLATNAKRCANKPHQQQETMSKLLLRVGIYRPYSLAFTDVNVTNVSAKSKSGVILHPVKNYASLLIQIDYISKPVIRVNTKGISGSNKGHSTKISIKIAII